MMNNVNDPANAILNRGPSAAAAPQFSFHTVVVAVRCWWHMALPLGLFLAVAAAATVYYFITPKFTATAWLFIPDVRPVLVTNALQEDPQKFKHNQIELMRSPLILGPVCGDPDVASAPELVKEPDRVVQLRNKLKVRTQGLSDYYLIEFSSESPAKAAKIVNLVADEYYRHHQRHEARITQDIVAKLIEHQGSHKNQVEQLRTRMEALAKQVGGQDLSNSGFDPATLTVRNSLANVENRLLQEQLEQLAKRSEVEVAKQFASKDSYEPSESEVGHHVQSIPEVNEIKKRIARDQARAANIRNAARDPKEHAELTRLETQIAEDEAKLATNVEELRTGVKAGLEAAARAKRQEGIQRLEIELQHIEAMVKFLEEDRNKKRKELQTVAGSTMQLEFARAEFELANQFLNLISERILKLQTERQAPERVEIKQYAPVPVRPDEAVPYKKMGMAGGIALLAPFGLAVALELLFRRVSSREQLESGGQIAVVGEVTALPVRVKLRNRNASAASRELHLFEESIDGLRTYLTLIDSMRDCKVLAVTSAISREGKSSLAAQLAISTASSTSRPTLLIDADMRSPDMHRIFGVARGPGLCEALFGSCPVEEAIDTSFSNTLHLLTAGDLAGSPHRLLGSRKFLDLLTKLRQMYDHIIIDTPPILAASEALVLASAADVAVLCVRRDYSRIDQVVDAMGRLRSSGVKMAGAVLNGIPPRHYAYRYGSYCYTRQDYSEAGESTDVTS